MNQTEIYLDDDQRQCRVITGPERRVYLASPRSVGFALMGMSRVDVATPSNDMTWVDLLSSHGTAIGIRGRMLTTMMITPSMRRAVTIIVPNARGELIHTETSITFPPTLMGLTTDNGTIAKAVLFLIDMAQQATFNVVSPTPVLVPWPYGNVYHDSGRICWGTVPHNDIHTIKDLESTFFGSGFNHDLFQAGVAGVARLTPDVALPTPAGTFGWAFPRIVEQLIRS